MEIKINWAEKVDASAMLNIKYFILFKQIKLDSRSMNSNLSFPTILRRNLESIIIFKSQ